MLAKEAEDYLRMLRMKADDPDTVEAIINGMDIIKIEYVKGVDSNGIAEEIIQIVTD